MPIEFQIIKNTEDHDSDDVIMHGQHKGFGYKFKKDGKIGLIRCPDCGKENYAMSVSTGVCCWCGWDVNKFNK